jgi:uncharacterized protein (TIRG00374 family)
MRFLKKALIVLLKISISVILLIFLFKQIDIHSLLDIIKGINKPLLAIAYVFSSSIYIICFYRWKMLLSAVGLSVSPARLIAPFSGGVFFNVFLPSTVGGDVVKSMDLALHTKKPSQVVATVILDRISGYAGMTLVAVAACILGIKLIQVRAVLWAVAGIAGILIVLLLAVFNKFVYSRIRKLFYSHTSGKIWAVLESVHEEMHNLKDNKKVIIKNLTLSLLIQLISPVSMYIVSLSMGAKINLLFFLVFLPIVGAITLLPISIGGLGLRDYTMVLLFAKAGVSKDLALAMSLLGFGFILLNAAIAGLIYVFTLHHRRV